MLLLSPPASCVGILFVGRGQRWTRTKQPSDRQSPDRRCPLIGTLKHCGSVHDIKKGALTKRCPLALPPVRVSGSASAIVY